jgi:hypothetical protein
MAAVGTIRGGDPTRSQRASELVREIIREKHAKEYNASRRADLYRSHSAIIEADDSWHSACLEALQSVRIPLFTTEVILGELFHGIGKRAHNIGKAWNFVRTGAVTLRPVDDSDLPTLQALMVQ